MEIARRDLHPGDELTCEYGLDYVSEAFDCRCRSPACRGTLVPADPTAQRRRWDRESQEAFDHALTVDQPALAAAASVGPGAAIVAAILARRPMRLPSWLDGTPGSAVGQPRRS